MNAIERLKDSIRRVEILVDFYNQNPTTTLDMMDSMTAVTIGDLKTLLDGLADRDISIKYPEPTEIEIEMAKQSILEQESWIKGYDKGYEAGRNGERKRTREIFERNLMSMIRRLDD